MLNKKPISRACICWILICLISLLSACSSAKIKLGEEFKAESLRSLAILPTDYPPDIQREKVDIIVEAVRQELKNKNYIVLAEKLVKRVCGSPACPERPVLAEKYDVDGFVTVKVASVSRTNFLAGFYNAVKGSLVISDVSNTPLVQVESSQSERGGLLFNSSQIIQGIISYSENTEAASFPRLVSGFAERLVAKIPRAELEVDSDDVAVNISKVELKQLEPEVFQICAEATPDSLVTLVVNRRSSNLRPVKPHKYCGSFLYNQSSASVGGRVYVDARSPFGNSVRKEVDIASEVQVCNISDKVVLAEKNGKPQIKIACVDIGSGASGECEGGEVNHCPGNRFIVFRSNSDLGPYEKVAEIRSTSWIDRGAKDPANTHYELVSVNKSGVWSLPVAPKTLKKEG